MSLLRDIQNELSVSGADVTIVLRKCKLLAARLGSVEFAQWVDWELIGYPASQSIPGYRRLSLRSYATFSSIAWNVPRAAIPMQFIPEQHRDSFTEVEFRDGIVKAVSFSQNSHSISINRPEAIWLLQGKMYPEMACHGVWSEVSPSDFKQLVSAVEHRILDFVIEIERENPAAGEAAMNTQPVPQEKLQTLVNNFYGAVGNVAQHSNDFHQAASVGFSRDDLTKLVSELTEHLGELPLDATQRRTAEVQIATLRAQLAGDPDPVIVHQAGKTLRNVTEGAIAGLIATAMQPSVWHGVQALLAAFPHK